MTWLRPWQDCAQRLAATVQPPQAHIDPELLALTWGKTWYRPGERQIVNGLVQIGTQPYADSGIRRGTAHVHHYGTSVIGNKLRSMLRQPSMAYEAALTLEYDREPTLFADQTHPSQIVFRLAADRALYFAPVDGDEDGWNEMLAYARQLIDSGVVDRIRQAVA